MKIHPSARTTLMLREEIHHSKENQASLAKKYNVTRLTIRKWQKREIFADKSHRPDHLKTTLSEAQEQVVIALRKTLLLPLDDLLAVSQTFINENVSRAGLHRCLKRFDISNLHQMKKALDTAEAGVKTKKSFKDYKPGFIHIDIKYLPQMADECSRSYLLVGIDRATRWVYMEVVKHKTAANTQRFLKRLINKAPFKISKILTDNGKEFTDRFIANGEREPTGNHAFDQACAEHDIEHRLIKPKHPQTNGMVERFNGRISDIMKTTHFRSSEDLKTTLTRYLKIYNYHIPQKALGHIAPIQSLKEWSIKRPEIFTKRVYNQVRPDS